MLSLTRRALEEFDNSHDFERMAADILNALGYEDVEPMAPSGGGDAGTDIKYTDAESPAIAFVTVNKNIKSKFASDLQRVKNQKVAALSLFCTVIVTPAQKLDFSRIAAADVGATLTVYDLERIRSLLDTSLKDIRRRYLHIDDDVSTAIRAKVKTILRYPEAAALETGTMSMFEKMFKDLIPAKLFSALREYDPETLRTVPEVGVVLETISGTYYAFKGIARRLLETMTRRIGANVGVRIAQAWRIYAEYCFLRLSGEPRESLERGPDLLNYGITWDDAERVATLLKSDAEISQQLQELGKTHEALLRHVDELRTTLARQGA
jgi:hypothetical protein